MSSAFFQIDFLLASLLLLASYLKFHGEENIRLPCKPLLIDVSEYPLLFDFSHRLTANVYIGALKGRKSKYMF